MGVLVVFLLICAAAGAQDQPLLRVNTRLVEVDVVARSKNGPVSGLNVDDFTVFDDGKPQKIALFSVRSGRNDTVARYLLPPGAVTNRLDTQGEEPWGATVVLFDRLNTAPEDQANGTLALLKYLRSAGVKEQIAIYELNKTLQIVQEFTSDKDRLIARASHAGAQKSVDEGAADLVSDRPLTGDALTDAMTQNAASEMMDHAILNRANITQYALGLISKHLSGMPGRKKLVWITAAFPATYTYTGHRNRSTQIETREFSGKIDEAARVLNDANVAVYPIDPRPLTGEALTAPGIDTMNLLAGKTGGFAQYALGDITSAIQSAMQDSEITYSLGFYPASAKLDGSYHSLKVKVARTGVELRYRKGYIASEVKPVTEKQRQISLNEIFTNPLEETGLGLAAFVQRNPGKPGEYLLKLSFNPSEIHFERDNNRWVALLAVATQFPPKKRPNGTFEQIKVTLTDDRLKTSLREGYVIQRPFAAGDLRGDLRVVLQDRSTGLAGSVSVPIGNN